VLVVAAFTTGLGGPEHRVYLSERDAERQLHETLGVCVFVLTLLRVAWRMISPPPRVPGAGPAWMEPAGRWMQRLLYLLLVLVPLTAISGAWLEGHELLVWPFGALPSPIATQRAAGQWLSELHPWLGDAIVWLAGFHAAAALFHHFVLRDRVLRAMLPWS
jgi:cytochrome b561